jgi:hypothetical protein
LWTLTTPSIARIVLDLLAPLPIQGLIYVYDDVDDGDVHAISPL